MTVKKFLNTYIKKYFGSFLSILICVLFIGFIRQIFPKLFGLMIDEAFIANKDLWILLVVILSYGILFMCSQILHFIDNTTFSYLKSKMHFDIRFSCLKSLFNTDAKYLSKATIGELITVINNDVETVVDYINNCYINAFSMSLELAFALLMVFLTNPFILLYIVLAVATSIILSWLAAKIVKKRYEEGREIYSKNISWLVNILNGIREIKIFKAFDNVVGKYKTKTEFLMEYNKKTSDIEYATSKINGAWSLIINIGMIIFSYILIEKDLLTIGGYVATTIYMNTVLSMMGFYNFLSHAIPSGKISFNKIIDVLELDDENDKASVKGDIEFTSIKFDHFSFSYDKNKKIFDDLSLEIKKKDKIAIIGKSGAGKSTLINTLLGLNDDYNGSFSINNVEVKEIDKKYLRKHISEVSQNGVLFEGLSLKENLSLGLDISDDSILSYCKMAHIESYILSLEKGLDTIYGVDISDMSGGQKQRMLLARAFIKDAPIFLLDEATSALDYETEKIIFDNLEKSLSNKIVIFVSHRPSAINRMSKVYEIHNCNLRRKFIAFESEDNS